jgi:hypothetical protein
MRSLIVSFSALVIVGCSAGPEDVHDDAGFHIKPAEQDAGADSSADAKAEAHVEAAAPKPTPSCPNVPEDVSNFKPTTSPKPPRPYQASCGAGQVTAFYYACVGASATTYSCQSWESASQSNNDCVACMISNDYDSAWGPLVNHSDYAFINDTGCAQLLNGTACAAATWADRACAFEACDSICYGDGLASLNKCDANAVAGGCKSWDDAQTAACVTTQGAFNKCFVTDPQSGFVNVVSTFCGGS